jgi:uncharacterized protein
MKLVLDTNVLIAAFIGKGLCSNLVEHCLQVHSSITSEFILNELHEKLVQKFKYASEEANAVVELLRSRMKILVPEPLEAPVCRDPDDDIVLATAFTGNAVCIITGDKDLLVLKSFNTIEILPPSKFQGFEENH